MGKKKYKLSQKCFRPAARREGPVFEFQLGQKRGYIKFGIARREVVKIDQTKSRAVKDPLARGQVPVNRTISILTCGMYLAKLVE